MITTSHCCRGSPSLYVLVTLRLPQSSTRSSARLSSTSSFAKGHHHPSHLCCSYPLSSHRDYVNPTHFLYCSYSILEKLFLLQSISISNHHPNYPKNDQVKYFLILLAMIIFGVLDVHAMFCLHPVSKLS